MALINERKKLQPETSNDCILGAKKVFSPLHQFANILFIKKMISSEHDTELWMLNNAITFVGYIQLIIIYENLNRRHFETTKAICIIPLADQCHEPHCKISWKSLAKCGRYSAHKTDNLKHHHFGTIWSIVLISERNQDFCKHYQLEKT